jgi:hypothetical protein
MVLRELDELEVLLRAHNLLVDEMVDRIKMHKEDIRRAKSIFKLYAIQHRIRGDVFVTKACLNGTPPNSIQLFGQVMSASFYALIGGFCE